MVTNAAKYKIINNMTKFQVGTEPGHRAQEPVCCTELYTTVQLKW